MSISHDDVTMVRPMCDIDRFYDIHQKFGEQYVISTITTLSEPSPIKIHYLKEVCKFLVRRHQVLRLQSYDTPATNELGLPIIARLLIEPKALPIVDVKEYEYIEGQTFNDILEIEHCKFLDTTKGPFWRLSLVNVSPLGIENPIGPLKDNPSIFRQCLVLTMSHSMFDGLSIEQLWEEILEGVYVVSGTKQVKETLLSELDSSTSEESARANKYKEHSSASTSNLDQRWIDAYKKPGTINECEQESFSHFSDSLSLCPLKSTQAAITKNQNYSTLAPPSTSSISPPDSVAFIAGHTASRIVTPALMLYHRYIHIGLYNPLEKAIKPRNASKPDGRNLSRTEIRCLWLTKDQTSTLMRLAKRNKVTLNSICVAMGATAVADMVRDVEARKGRKIQKEMNELPLTSPRKWWHYSKSVLKYIGHQVRLLLSIIPPIHGLRIFGRGQLDFYSFQALSCRRYHPIYGQNSSADSENLVPQPPYYYPTATEHINFKEKLGRLGASLGIKNTEDVMKNQQVSPYLSPIPSSISTVSAHSSSTRSLVRGKYGSIFSPQQLERQHKSITAIVSRMTSRSRSQSVLPHLPPAAEDAANGRIVIDTSSTYSSRMIPIGRSAAASSESDENFLLHPQPISFINNSAAVHDTSSQNSIMLTNENSPNLQFRNRFVAKKDSSNDQPEITNALMVASTAAGESPVSNLRYITVATSNNTPQNGTVGGKKTIHEGSNNNNNNNDPFIQLLSPPPNTIALMSPLHSNQCSPLPIARNGSHFNSSSSTEEVITTRCLPTDCDSILTKPEWYAPENDVDCFEIPEENPYFDAVRSNLFSLSAYETIRAHEDVPVGLGNFCMLTPLVISIPPAKSQVDSPSSPNFDSEKEVYRNSSSDVHKAAINFGKDLNYQIATPQRASWNFRIMSCAMLKFASTIKFDKWMFNFISRQNRRRVAFIFSNTGKWDPSRARSPEAQNAWLRQVKYDFNAVSENGSSGRATRAKPETIFWAVTAHEVGVSNMQQNFATIDDRLCWTLQTVSHHLNDNDANRLHMFMKLRMEELCEEQVEWEERQKNILLETVQKKTQTTQ